MRIRPTRHNECEITTEDGTRITVKVDAARPEHRRYDPYGSLSEYGIFPERDAQPPADDADNEVVFFDGVGAARSSIKSCRNGVQWIMVGDRVYWPLSDSDAKRLHRACCGDGSFDGPATPAGEGERDWLTDAMNALKANGEVGMTTDTPTEGEEIMVNTPYGVFVLPLQPSELSSGPRFVVHVPSPEAPAVKALVEALETCLETEERPEVIELAKTALAAASQLARDGCHCGTCTCDPNMTPAVRFDLSPAQMEGAIRDHLIRLGWTPPDERAQHAAPTPVVDWTSLTAAQKEAWGRKMFQEAARGLWRCRSVTDQLLHWNGIPVHVTGTVTTSPSNWSLIDAALTTQQQEQPAAVAVDEAMVERACKAFLAEIWPDTYEDADDLRAMIHRILSAALTTTRQEPTT